MSERFRLAAKVLLKRRLDKLVRIDHQTEIDRDFITCAEYQLFIDEMRQQGKNRQPDHWTGEKFPDGDAKKPVTGVRRSDGEEFCEWLTNRDILPEFSYRLPTIKETEEITAVSQYIGCWCKDNNAFKISGITAPQWQIWQQKLSEYFVFQNKNLIVDLDRYFDRDLCRCFDLDLELYRDLDRYLDRDLELYRDLDRYRYLNRYRDLDLDLDLYRYLDLNLDLDLDRYRKLDRYQDLDRYLDLDLDLDLDRYHELYNEIATSTASNFLLLYFPLIVLILFYQSFTKIYADAVQNRKIRQRLKLKSQECKQKSKEYAQKQDKIFQLYAYLVLMDQRQKGNMPAWEGIIIVRERKESE